MTSFTAKICAFRFLDAFVLIYPLYTVMFVERGLSPVQISTILSAWALTTIVLEIPAGLVADRWSRRWILSLSQAARAAGFVLWIASPTYWGFFVGLALWGVKSSFTNGTFEALVYDELAAEGREGEYVQVIGRAHAAQASGVLLASLGAAALVRFGYPAVVWLSVAASLAAAVLAARLPRAPRRAAAGSGLAAGPFADGLRRALATPGALGLLSGLMLAGGIGGALQDYAPLFGQAAGLAAAHIALVMGGIGGARMLCAMLAHRFRRLPGWTFALAFLLQAGLLTAMAALLRPWTVLLLVAVAGLFKIVEINLEARLQAATPTHVRATLGSIRGFGSSAGFASATLLIGAAVQFGSYATALAVMGAILAVMGVAPLAARAAGRGRAPAGAREA